MLLQPFVLLCPESTIRWEDTRFVAAANRFFETTLEVGSTGALQTPDSRLVKLQGVWGTASLQATWYPLVATEAQQHIQRAWDAVKTMGGAGFEYLVPRTQSVVVVESLSPEPTSANVPEPAARFGEWEGAPLRLVAILASVLLAPILPPDGKSLFGVRGARERLRQVARI